MGQSVFRHPAIVKFQKGRQEPAVLLRRAAATVIPAQAGIQGKAEHGWIPACAGMTVGKSRPYRNGLFRMYGPRPPNSLRGKESLVQSGPFPIIINY